MSNFRIFEILRNIYFDFFSMYKTETDNRADSLKINKYYVIFENSTHQIAFLMTWHASDIRVGFNYIMDYNWGCFSEPSFIWQDLFFYFQSVTKSPPISELSLSSPPPWELINPSWPVSPCPWSSTTSPSPTPGNFLNSFHKLFRKFNNYDRKILQLN